MTGPGQPIEVWALGEAYEPYVGRWSRGVASALVPLLTVPAGARWLDVGSGTGALTSVLLEHAEPQTVIGIDASEGFVGYARSRIADPRASFQVGDALALPFRIGSFDAVVSGLVLNFVPDPARMVAEMARMTRPGGTVAVYVWDYAEKMQLMRIFWDAAVALDAGAAEFDEGRRVSLCRPQPLYDLFTGSGLGAVAVHAIDIPTTFRNFDDYWIPFLGGQGSAPGYAMSLDEESRAALRERLRATLPTEPDGSIPLQARAWAVRGTR